MLYSFRIVLDCRKKNQYGLLHSNKCEASHNFAQQNFCVNCLVKIFFSHLQTLITAISGSLVQILDTMDSGSGSQKRILWSLRIGYQIKKNPNNIHQRGTVCRCRFLITSSGSPTTACKIESLFANNYQPQSLRLVEECDVDMETKHYQK